jgi:hypothetical protein
MSTFRKIISIFFCILIAFLLCILFIYYLSFPLPTIETIQSTSETLRIYVEIIAIIIAGLWSFRLFIKNREDYPVAEVNHAISHWNLGNNHVYLSLLVTIKNCGKVLIQLDSGMIIVQQILPLLDELKGLIQESSDEDISDGKSKLFHEKNSQIAWREIGCREPKWKMEEVNIEPGESEEFQYDFILKEDILSIRIKTYFKNIKYINSNIGWRKTTSYNLKGISDG